jgi:predicted DNA-binding transcriptional regulator AlpA
VDTQQQLPKVYLTMDQVASMLQISKGTLQNWSYRNFGPPRAHIGGQVRYPADELYAWIEGQTKREGDPT